MKDATTGWALVIASLVLLTGIIIQARRYTRQHPELAEDDQADWVLVLPIPYIVGILYFLGVLVYGIYILTGHLLIALCGVIFGAIALLLIGWALIDYRMIKKFNRIYHLVYPWEVTGKQIRSSLVISTIGAVSLSVLYVIAPVYHLMHFRFLILIMAIFFTITLVLLIIHCILVKRYKVKTRSE